MVKQEATAAPTPALASVELVTRQRILGDHKTRQRFRERITYAQRHMKEIQKREGIKRASKATSSAIYNEAVVPTSSDLLWTTIKLVQRSGKSTVKAWHLQNVREWQQGVAPLDPELSGLVKIPPKWEKDYLAAH